MAVNGAVTLPAQPAQGDTVYMPLGGDGKAAPSGCYFVNLEVDGDASGGNAGLTITLDSRYTNLVAYMNLSIQADAGAGDFSMVIQPNAASSAPPRPEIVGTLPQIATGSAFNNGVFLWYPPPVYYQGEGVCSAKVPNVGALETYKLQIEVLVFNIDVRRLSPLPLLMLNVPGVSAPAAV